MMRTVALLLACVALAAAVPTDHKVNHVTSAKHISNHENAKQALKMLQAKGTDASACRELSETTKKEVEDEVNSLQAVIDGLDDGANCDTEGQDAVDAATNAKSMADQAHKDAVDALAAAADAGVVFGSKAFNSLTEGECSYFFGSDAYIAAKATHTAAVADESATAGAATAASTALDEALADQGRLIHNCRCKAKHNYEAAWAAAEEGAAARESTYTQALHMLCVLDETSTADCAVTVPTCTPRTLPEEVSSVEECSNIPTLAMIIGASDHQFWYADSKWSTSDLFDNGSSKKTAAFNMKSDCITIKDTSSGNEIHWEHGLDSSPKDLVNGHHIDSGIALGTWQNWIPGAAGQHHCNRQGFQARDDSSWRPVRFGLVMNQENNCGTPDTSIGIGLNTGCCAGSECGCCNNFGSCTNNCREVEVYVCGKGAADDGSLKIEGGGHAGRLMAMRDGEWGTVCDDHFDVNNNGADVACRQMGYAGGVYSANYRGTEPDESVVKIVYDDIQCTGTEARIQDCPGFRLHNSDSCSHGEDSGVICSH